MNVGPADNPGCALRTYVRSAILSTSKDKVFSSSVHALLVDFLEKRKLSIALRLVTVFIRASLMPSKYYCQAYISAIGGIFKLERLSVPISLLLNEQYLKCWHS